MAVVVVAHFLPGVHLADYQSALLLAVVLAFLNAIVKPILTVLTIPITIVTLGIFLLVINAIIIFIAERLVEGFKVDGFFTAIIFSLVLSICTGILNGLFGLNKKSEE